MRFWILQISWGKYFLPDSLIATSYHSFKNLKTAISGEADVILFGSFPAIPGAEKSKICKLSSQIYFHEPNKMKSG